VLYQLSYIGPATPNAFYCQTLEPMTRIKKPELVTASFLIATPLAVATLTKGVLYQLSLDWLVNLLSYRDPSHKTLGISVAAPATLTPAKYLNLLRIRAFVRMHHIMTPHPALKSEQSKNHQRSRSNSRVRDRGPRQNSQRDVGDHG
jgi:hypothetical protein